MSEKIIFATGNAGKLKEIREILKDLNREIVTMREAGFEGEIEENGTTFRENAEIKAKAVWEKTGGIVLADDSGLVIDYLNGEPGVYSVIVAGKRAGVQAAIKATGAASVSKLPPDSYTSVWEELLKLKDEVDANASN